MLDTWRDIDAWATCMFIHISVVVRGVGYQGSDVESAGSSGSSGANHLLVLCLHRVAGVGQYLEYLKA